ncbi:MAG: sigma-54 dependent transcriptional regulator [Thermodesulfobacteriota bacterium]
MAQERSNSDITILVVDDEFSIRDSLQAWLSDEGYEVGVAASGEEALRRLVERDWDIFFVDLRMPGMGGMELLDRIKEAQPDGVIIIMTAYASVDSAVQAMKSGAYDYLSKPFDPDHLAMLVRNAIERKRLVDETHRLKTSIATSFSADEIIGDSPAVVQVLEQVRAVAEVDSTVLIRGESGTGKELVARAIHVNSQRRYAPLVTINCGALPETILESELFGHEKGAFTGAHQARKGKFEMADGGTIFLDEIGNISPKIQMEFLRVLEDKRFYRVGGSKEIRADFRIIAATNKDLTAAMEREEFRSDLYYRLNVFVIEIPPLRERRGDIPVLASHFLAAYSRQMARNIKGINQEAMALLQAYDWPGNVRELENAIERAVVVSKGSLIEPFDLPITLRRPEKRPAEISDLSLDGAQRVHIARVLELNEWNISRAAEELKIDRVTLYNKIKKYGLRK